MESRLPLVVITGPTASGKTSLAIRLAEKYNGEIICADSRTVYIGMDIGTAKPTQQERERVVHWGLDLVEPGARFTAADFKIYAESKISDIRRRGKIPFLVGGTGLYIDAVLFDYQFGDDFDAKIRAEFEKMSIESLHKYCIQNSITLPDNKYNKRYVIRAIEQKGVNGKRNNTPISSSVIVGIATERELLRTRIAHRAEQLFNDSVVEEATILGTKYGWGSEAMTGNIYPLVRQYLDGAMTMEQLKEKFIVLDWRLAKRQLTWLRRNDFIVWKNLDQAEHYLTDILDTCVKS
ncbi:MAG: tRNA (adenosine(37)-N6)-dimethylallyltransferase MiaA [Chloroflexi bacterium]|nr:MAG: tRNA (adenosine(37)-N6)-dimethylallyltransferase MiaA [Chloroflexota bacterium]